MKKQDILKAFPVESNSVPETAINTNQYVKTNSIKRVQNYTDILYGIYVTSWTISEMY